MSALASRDAEIRRLRTTGMTAREIAAHFGIGIYTVERIFYRTGEVTSKKGAASSATVRRNCLRCRKPFDAHKVIFRCDNCREATRDYCDAMPVGVVSRVSAGRGE